MASGPPSDGARSIGPALAGDPGSVLVVLDLLIAESRKKRLNDGLIAALLFMLREALNESRMRSESRGTDTPTLADAVRAKLGEAAAAGRLRPELLLLIARQFAAAKLDIGEELRSRMVELADQAGAGDAAAGSEKREPPYAELAGGLGHDPFLIHGQMSESLSAYPAEQRLAIIASIVNSDVPSMRDAAVGWLLDPDPVVALSVARMLHHAAERGLVAPASAGRLVVIRNWVADDVKGMVDQTARLLMQRGVAAGPGGMVQVGAVMASGCDGSGAQSFFVQVKRGRKLGLASVLVKAGLGVRDAWVNDGMSKREADLTLREFASELDPFNASLDIVRCAVANALAIGMEQNTPPPFGLVQFIEAVGLAAVLPAAMPTEQLIGSLLHDLPGDRTSAPAVARALAASKRWPERYACVQSWFEDIDGKAPIFAGARTRKQRQDIVLTKILPDKRARWATLLAWTAKDASDEVESDDWIEIALVAREMLGNRPLNEIPIACWIAKQTAEALAGS